MKLWFTCKTHATHFQKIKTLERNFKSTVMGITHKKSLFQIPKYS